VIVKDADEWYRQFHDRMAVILSPDSYEQWLDPARKSGQLELLQDSGAHSDEELEYYPISTLVNNPRNDSAECLELTEPKEDIELTLDL
jgi:putative SOS response-associated peptidase YedK